MEVSGDSRGYGRRNIARASCYGGRTEGDQFFGVQQQPYKSYAEVVLDQKKRSQGSGKDNIERVISIRWDAKEFDSSWLSRCAVGVMRTFRNLESVNQRLSLRGFKFSSKIRMTEDPAPVDHWWLSSFLGLQTSKAQSFSDKPDMDRADCSFKKVAEKVSSLSSLEGRTLDIEKVNGSTTCGIIQISNKSVDQDKFRRGKVKESRGVRKVNRYHFKLSKKRGGLGVLDKASIDRSREKTRQTGAEESDIETSSSELKGRSGFFLLKGECSRRANPIGPMVTDSVGLSGPSNQGVELKEINDGLQDQADNLSRPDKASHETMAKVGNSDRKMESSVHDMRRRASSGVPDPPNSIKRSFEFDEEAVETRPSQIIDENVESPKHQSKKGRGVRVHQEGVELRGRIVEITKEIEKGAALGVDFKTNDGVSNGNDHWSVDEEIAKVIETSTALGLDFNRNEDLMAEIIKDREREDKDRLEAANL
ncbi:hypothetical protein Q3G72_003625 [Acer saccharum]|nr:hypothetical protein Q3G72_003625 [Acer saccharum]